MKLFTISEANELLPTIIPKLKEIKQLYAAINDMRDSSRAAASASEFGGGMEGGAGYVKALYRVGKLTTDLTECGIELKDYTRGLIDFPSMRSQRVVYLCWQLGDAEEVEWWHETDAGFAGRQRI
ncbi:MAG: DUF2203 domain-containing protein [Acidobacteria bacterium]|nr:DUF2203 domain-containing protein [Acidobacteriota bacterium]